MAENNRALFTTTKTNDKSKSEVKHWHITFNNVQENEHYQLIEEKLLITFVPPSATHQMDVLKITKPFDIAWMVGQVEKGEESGIIHIHLHICLTDKASWTKILKFIQGSNYNGAHIEKVHNIDQHLEYVTKEKTRMYGPYRSDSAPKKGEPIQGNRTDLVLARDYIRANGFKNAINNNDHFNSIVKHIKGFMTCDTFTRTQQPRPNHVVVVLYGQKSGMGKSVLATWLADYFFKGIDHFYKNMGKWYDGYTGEKVIIMDDFDGKGQAIQEIKNVLDKVPCTVEIKGFTTPLTQELTVITTNTRPSAWFSDKTVPVHSFDIDAVLRRCIFFRIEDELWDWQVNPASAANVLTNVIKPGFQYLLDTIIHSVNQERKGIRTIYKGVEGERLLADVVTTGPTNNGGTAPYVQSPSTTAMLSALTNLSEEIIEISDSEENIRTQQFSTPVRLGRRPRVPDAPERPEARNVRPRTDLPIPKQVFGGSPIPPEGSAENPIIL